MRRFLALLTSGLCLVSLFALTGCGSKEEPKTDDSAAAAAAKAAPTPNAKGGGGGVKAPGITSD